MNDIEENSFNKEICSLLVASDEQQQLLDDALDDAIARDARRAYEDQSLYVSKADVLSADEDENDFMEIYSY